MALLVIRSFTERYFWTYIYFFLFHKSFLSLKKNPMFECMYNSLDLQKLHNSVWIICMFILMSVWSFPTVKLSKNKVFGFYLFFVLKWSFFNIMGLSQLHLFILTFHKKLCYIISNSIFVSNKWYTKTLTKH